MTTSKLYAEHLENPEDIIIPTRREEAFDPLCSAFFPYIDSFEDWFIREWNDVEYLNNGFRILNVPAFIMEYEKLKDHELMQNDLWMVRAKDGFLYLQEKPKSRRKRK